LTVASGKITNEEQKQHNQESSSIQVTNHTVEKVEMLESFPRFSTVLLLAISEPICPPQCFQLCCKFDYSTTWKVNVDRCSAKPGCVTINC